MVCVIPTVLSIALWSQECTSNISGIGRAIGKRIDFLDISIKISADLQDFGINFRRINISENWYKVRHTFSEDWYNVRHTFSENWYNAGHISSKNWYMEQVCL